MIVDGVNITGARIKPLLGWGNSPNLYLSASHFPPKDNYVYNYDVNEGVYWTQTEGGFTHFLYHEAPRYVDGRWGTRDHDGFSGHTFRLRVNWEGKIITVDVVGPWSGGCYSANKVLPKPAVEVSINNTSSNLTLDVVTEIIREFNLMYWTIELNGSLGHDGLSPEFRYKGLLKRDWTEEIRAEIKELNLDGYSDDVRKRLGL